VLHWCDALVGEFGSKHRTDFAVLGSQVEAAARFSAHLEAGAVGATPAFYTELSTALEGKWGIDFHMHPLDDVKTRLFLVHGVAGP
jgi:class 3 adenylate cyclase